MASPPDPSAQEIELSIDSRLADVALLGGAVRGVAAVLGFGEAELYHLELCLVEAASNSVRHAYLSEAGHPVRVRITADARGIEMRVADRGRPIPAERRTPPVLEVDPRNLEALHEGGRGVFLMHTLMDEVRFATDDGWNEVILVKRRGGS